MPGFEDALLGAALGTVLQNLVDAILAAIRGKKRKQSAFGQTLQRLETAVRSLEPAMRAIVALENAPTDTYPKFLAALTKAAKILDIYTQRRKRDLLRRRKFKKRIREFDEYLQRFLSIELKAVHSQQIAEIVDRMVRLDEKMDKTIRLLQVHEEADAPEGSDLKHTNAFKERPAVGIPVGSSNASEPVVGPSSSNKKERKKKIKHKVQVKFCMEICKDER